MDPNSQDPNQNINSNQSEPTYVDDPTMSADTIPADTTPADANITAPSEQAMAEQAPTEPAMAATYTSESTVTETVTTAPAIDSADATSAKEPTKDKPKTKNLGLKIATAILAVTTVAGAGFGAWAMISGQQEISGLKSEISSLKKSNAALMEENQPTDSESTGDTTIIVEGEDTPAPEPMPTPTPVEDTENYIYVGEFGIKIRKPENWLDSLEDYTYYNGYPQAASTISITERQVKEVGIVVSETGLSSCDEISAGSCVMINGIVYQIREAIVTSATGTSDTLSEDFRNHFLNPDNYSAI